jgi:hypothetical protein
VLYIKAWIDVKCPAEHLSAISVNALDNQDVRVVLRRGNDEVPQNTEFRSGSLYNLLDIGHDAVLQEKFALKVFPFASIVVGLTENEPGLFVANQEYLSMAFLEVFLEKVVIQIGADPLTNLFHLFQVVVISVLRCWNDSRRTRLSPSRREKNVLEIAVGIGENERLRGSVELSRLCCCGKLVDLIDFDSLCRRWYIGWEGRRLSLMRNMGALEVAIEM